MFVFVATYNVDYEGSDIIGIFSTMARAKKQCEDNYAEHPYFNQPKRLRWGGGRVNASARHTMTRASYIIEKMKVDVPQ